MRDWLYWAFIDVKCWAERIWFCHHNARVLADMEFRLSCVLSRVTNCLSKPYYTWETMEAAIQEREAELLDQGYREGESEARLDMAFAVPAADWHEDDGPVLWWRFPVEEAPWVGTPLDDDWRPGYYTHWTELVLPTEPSK